MLAFYIFFLLETSYRQMQCSLKLQQQKFVFLKCDVHAELSSSPMRHFICGRFSILLLKQRLVNFSFSWSDIIIQIPRCCSVSSSQILVSVQLDRLVIYNILFLDHLLFDAQTQKSTDQALQLQLNANGLISV